MLSADYAYVALPTVNNARSTHQAPSLHLSLSLSLSLFRTSLFLLLKIKQQREICRLSLRLNFMWFSACACKYAAVFSQLVFPLIYAAQHAAFGFVSCVEKGVGGGAEWGVALFGYWQSSALRWLFGHLNRFEWHNLPLIWIIAKPIILALPFSCQCNLIYTRIAPLKVMR